MEVGSRRNSASVIIVGWDDGPAPLLTLLLRAVDVIGRGWLSWLSLSLLSLLWMVDGLLARLIDLGRCREAAPGRFVMVRKARGFVNIGVVRRFGAELLLYYNVSLACGRACCDRSFLASQRFGGPPQSTSPIK